MLPSPAQTGSPSTQEWAMMGLASSVADTDPPKFSHRMQLVSAGEEEWKQATPPSSPPVELPAIVQLVSLGEEEPKHATPAPEFPEILQFVRGGETP